MICGQSSTLMVLTLQAVHKAAAEYIAEMEWGAHIQFDQAKGQILLNICCTAAVLLAHLKCNKSLSRCFSAEKQDFRATSKINVSLKFIQCSATF